MIYKLMNRNIEVLSFSYDEETHTIIQILSLIQPAYAPLGIIEYKTGITRKAFNHWWKDRSIPASRSRFREVMEELDISSSVELLEKCYGLSLSDHYWIKEENSDLDWKDINFFDHDFSEDMGKLLMGQVHYSGNLNMFSPDNSSDGNLKKKWKIIDQKRCLIKGGNSFNNQEPFNEVIATKLYERILNIEDFVPYEFIEEKGVFYSVCPNMVTSDEELVSAYYIDRSIKQRSNDPLYQHFLDACSALKIPNAKLQINKMLVCDYIIANYDRHYRNFGAIRNSIHLSWKGLAPIYDNGSSLWANQPTSAIGNTYRSKPFQAIPEEQLKLVEDMTWLDLTKLNGFEHEVADILRKNPYMEEERISAISQQVKSRIDKVAQRKAELEHR